MLLTENEGKDLLALHGVSVSQGVLVSNAGELSQADLDYPVAIKAQVASGGRGKAGGVKRADDRTEANAVAEEMFSREFNGELPEFLLVEPWLSIDRELYLAVTIDGQAGGYVILYSPAGGVEIEQGAPPVRYEVGPAGNFRGYRLREILTGVEPDAKVRERIIATAARLLAIATSRDCLTVEINPLAVLENGRLLAADAKIVRDESAAFRAKDIRQALEKSRTQQPQGIAAALENSLMLVWLDGNIGLISGGAGMTMAAMDSISAAGGNPACFLDCSANPTPAGYRMAFDLLDSEPKVKVILVSIFGGGTQMDRVARVMSEIMAARKSVKPVVFRLNGTNAEKVADVFQPAGLNNHSTLENAVQEAVSMGSSAS